MRATQVKSAQGILGCARTLIEPQTLFHCDELRNNRFNVARGLEKRSLDVRNVLQSLFQVAIVHVASLSRAQFSDNGFVSTGWPAFAGHDNIRV